jgi:predicted transcriptional regulator of viral defense system
MFMKALRLQEIKKLYFGYEDIARILGISLSSARVSAARYNQQGVLIRIKRNLYILREKWQALSKEEKFILANLIQSPSYISLMSAMDYHQVTTQIQQDFVESVAFRRTKTVTVRGTVFNYSKINPALYFGFKKENYFFIATPEKAFLDAFYLSSLGRYYLDFPSIDFSKFNINEINKILSIYPGYIQKRVLRNDYFRTA